MSFRPQFAYPTPPGFRDDQFHYAFNGLTTPGLTGSIPTLGTVGGFPLLLESDSQFIWRGVKVSAAGGSSLALQLKDPFGNYLSDNYVPCNQYVTPSGIGTLIGTQPVPLESEIICPPGGIVWLYLQNPTGGTYTIDISVSLFGVKRFQDARCAA